jgi:hypothetical protein
MTQNIFDQEAIDERIIQANGLELELHLFANRWRRADKTQREAVDAEVRTYLSQMHLSPAAVRSAYGYYDGKKQPAQKYTGRPQ